MGPKTFFSAFLEKMKDKQTGNNSQIKLKTRFFWIIVFSDFQLKSSRILKSLESGNKFDFMEVDFTRR